MATFSLSAGSRTYARDFFELHTDFWLTVYWVLLCTTLTYLLLFGARALLILRKDPRSRRIASVYLFATGSAIAACAVRTITALSAGIAGIDRHRAGVAVRVSVRLRFRVEFRARVAAEPLATGTSELSAATRARNSTRKRSRADARTPRPSAVPIIPASAGTSAVMVRAAQPAIAEPVANR